MRNLVIIAAINGFLAVSLGAFGAHILDGNISDHYLGVWEKAVKYQMFHTGGMLTVAVLAHLFNQKIFVTAGYFMLAGIVFFSGSLYLLAVTSIGVFGAITPIGGVLFLVGWVMLIVGMMRSRV